MFPAAVWTLILLQIVRGQTIIPVFVQSNAPVTLTCPADDQAAILTWTGPGGNLYVTGTTVEAGLNDVIKSRISVGHSGGSYTLTFTEFQAKDTGIYTCTVDGTVGLRMVIIQGVTSASPVYTGQGGTVTLQCTDTGGTAQWVVTSPVVFIYTIGTSINPAIPVSTTTRLSVTRRNGNYNLHISDVQLSDVREYRCTIGVTNTYYYLILYNGPSTVSLTPPTVTYTPTEGQTIPTITCSTDCNPVCTFIWTKDGQSYTTGSGLQLTNIQLSQGGGACTVVRPLMCTGVTSA
ncbi:uncharacterized protein LOC117316202 isoform X2 [Pecten maximus]|uniref:uncharacterized protein LOC117316202 isoform X2 n=1 Tax=Pecten maximus TaxID=6579 RepID=UPI001458B747|nr:uncharacterized protein LOC117316202 isoform X2 [Pecten maximus]